MKSAVIYCSRSGKTRQVAKRIAEQLDGDMIEIVGKKRYRGPFGFILAGAHASRKKLPEIEPVQADLSTYDTLVIGSPVWASTVAAPVRTFLHQYKEHIKEASFFLTLGGSGAEKAFSEIENVAQCKPTRTLALVSREVNNLESDGEAVKKIEAFAAGLVK
jgi:flavodoxin